MLKTSNSNSRAALLAIIIIHLISITAAKAEGRVFLRVPTGDVANFSQSTVYDIRRTDDRYTWFASSVGLIRFDGEHNVRIPFPSDDPNDKIIKTIVPIAGGGLLIGTVNHLFRMRTDENKYKIEPILEEKAFSATCGETLPNGYSIIGGDGGLVVFSVKTEKTTQVKLSDQILNLSNNVIDIAISPEAIYALTKGGIFRLDHDLKNITAINSDVDISGLSPTSIACSADHLYVGTSGDGVFSLNLLNGNAATTGYTDSGNVVTSLEYSPDDDTLFIGTDGSGVTKVALASGHMTSYRHRVSDSVSPSSNQVYSLLYDNFGQLWIGFYQNGADYTPQTNGPFELYDNPAVFNSRGIPVRALSIGSEYNAIGTREGVVVHHRGTNESWDVSTPQLRSEMVISLLNKDGKIYVGTYGGGMKVLDPAFRKVSDYLPAKDDQVFKNGHIFTIADDRKGGLWVGTNDGLFYFDEKGNEKHFTSYQTALPEGNVYCVFFDSEGKGWICTDTGVCIYDPHRKMLRTDIFPVSFPKGTRFRTVYEDSRKRLYFVPENGYVYSCRLDFSDPQTIDFPMMNGTDAKGIVEDSFGNMWIATDRGIFMMDSAGSIMRFGLSSGLPSVSFLQAQPQADGNGGIWFGNSEGLLRLNEDLVEQSVARQIIPVPTKVTVNGKILEFIPQPDKNGTYKIYLDTPTNNIKIGFTSFTYAIEESDAYQYSVDGGEWQRFKSDMSVSLYDLTPGRHRLRVRSASDSDYNRDKELEVAIHIPYPVSWKIGLAVIVLLMLFSVSLACRIFYMKRKISDSDSSDDSDKSPASAIESKEVPQKKYTANTMSRNEARQISAKIDEVMTHSKPYLNPELKVGQLAEMIGISSHKLSQFFSQHKDISFYDYVNKYRVDEFKRMVKEDDVRNLTLSAMAEKAGFSSRASFFRYFKNIEGISPGEYLKTRQKL